MEVRHTPEIHFVYDSSFEDENKISKLLDNESSDEE
jgi:ribosome-binding factor A